MLVSTEECLKQRLVDVIHRCRRHGENWSHKNVEQPYVRFITDAQGYEMTKSVWYIFQSLHMLVWEHV